MELGINGSSKWIIKNMWFNYNLIGCQTITKDAVKRKGMLLSPGCPNAHLGYMSDAGWSACTIGSSYLQIDFRVNILLTSLTVAGSQDSNIPKLATEIKIEYQLTGQVLTHLMVYLLQILIITR
jgi:hypothetical protein